MPEHVLVIGAGLGGLALAHGLQKAGVSFHVYERDPSAKFRPQGYRVRITPLGAEALDAVLSPEHFRHFELSCANPPGMIRNLDAITGVVKEVPHRPTLPRIRSEKYGSYTADRIVTRDVLLQGLGERISFGKGLVSFETAADHVTAQFKDGTEATGTLLVGADGVRSPVRRQGFPPHLAPLDTLGRALYGKTILTPELEAQLPEVVRNTTCLIQDRSRDHVLTLFSETVRFDRTNGVEHPEDYIYWVLLSDRSIFEEAGVAEVAHLSAADAAAAAIRATSHWDAQLRKIMENQNLGHTSGLRICTAVPGRLKWESRERVTALGDAIHIAPPAGGQGANMALRDAAALVKALTEESPKDGNRATTEKSLIERIRKYEEEMRTAVGPAVEASLSGGKWMFDQRPYDECEVATFE